MKFIYSCIFVSLFMSASNSLFCSLAISPNVIEESEELPEDIGAQSQILENKDLAQIQKDTYLIADLIPPIANEKKDDDDLLNETSYDVKETDYTTNSFNGKSKRRLYSI